MLKIDPAIVQAVVAAKQPSDLYPHLQCAIELEHATIPLYLTAFLSIKSGFMADIRGILKSVFVEEMLHMSIACNVLNAINGQPVINQPKFIPAYPGPLPMNIGDLQVHLAPLSEAQVELFMKIEEPEDPLVFPVKTALFAAAPPTFATIGLFYQALIEKIEELGDGIFKGDPRRQVVNTPWFPATELFPIRNVNDAVRGLRLIVEQGEGTKKSPLSSGELAHYYRFTEISKGKRLVKDPSVPQGFSYSGAPITFDAAGVWNMLPDPKASSFREGSRARRLVDQFNYTYTSLLNSLHDTFNGQPQSLDAAMGLMFELNIVGGQVVETTDEVSGKQAAPSFEYAAINADAAGG
jgi:hypothetical protein